jgi:metal-responsive CopG/Arc/MetJ family transcriptional regulator
MAKVMISIPDDELARIDAEAARRGTSRSALLREAALSEIDRPRPDRVREALRRGQALLAGIDPGVDLTAMIRHDRDTRDEDRLRPDDA